MFQDRFINTFKAAIQSISNTEKHDSTEELYNWLREKTKELREKDIEGPFRRNIQPGQRSDEVIDKCIGPNLAKKDPHQVLDLRMSEGKIVACTRGGGVPGSIFCWVCAAGLSEPLPHYSLFCGQIIDPILVTFWQMQFFAIPT